MPDRCTMMLSSTRGTRSDGAMGWRYLPLIAAALPFIGAGAFNLPAPVLLQRRCASHHWRTDILHSSKTDEVSGVDKNIGHTDYQPHVDTENIPNGDVLYIHIHNETKELANAEDTTKENNDTPDASKNVDDTETTTNNINDAPASKTWYMPLSPRHKAGAPLFLFPWSFWMKIRSTIPGAIHHHHHEIDSNTSQSKSSNPKQKSKRRWEVPLTSKPYQCPDELRSTIRLCIGAIALYFVIGTSFPLWLEPSWSFIDSCYFSMSSLTTVGYGDVVVSGVNGAHGIMAKLFVLSFNIYAVCISVSALGIIAKLALTQEKKFMYKAKERARQRLIKMFESEQDDEEDDDDIEEEDEEQRQWADRIIDEKIKHDLRDEPRSIIGALRQALRNNFFNFLVLAFIAGLLRRVEGWSFIDVLYYWNCTATTIGFGDVCPQTQLGRLLAIGFIPLSVVTLGEVIASVFAFITSRMAAKAEKDFLRREITFSDLDYLDVNDDGKVCELDFITFMLVAMQKVDRKTMKDLQRIFHALDAGKDGFLQKDDLVELRQRKRFSKRLRRDARKMERWFETKSSLKKNTKKRKKWLGWSFQ